MNIGEKKIHSKLTSIHMWLSRHYGKADLCENKNCPHKSVCFDWALIKGCKYYKNRKNFKKLCRSCHKFYDMTESTKRKISIANSGKIRSEEFKKRISNAKKGIPATWKWKEVIAIKNNKPTKYKSITFASKETKTLQTSIANCLKGRSKKANNYKWLYA